MSDTYYKLAIDLLNQVKAWRDCDGNDGFPHETREQIDALLMAHELRQRERTSESATLSYEENMRRIELSRGVLRDTGRPVAMHYDELEGGMAYVPPDEDKPLPEQPKFPWIKTLFWCTVVVFGIKIAIAAWGPMISQWSK